MKKNISILITFFITICSSCNNNGSNAKPIANDTSVQNTNAASQSTTQKNIPDDTTVANTENTVTSSNQNSPDSILSQMKNLSSMFGKNDSGILKNFGGSNMDSMMNKMQSLMGGKSGNPGDAIANSILNLQLGQMKDNNPLKSVATAMMEAQKNGTAGPSKIYTATYTPEQPADYTVPVSGSGNTIMLQYTGGSIENNKKDGLWKNIYISTNKTNKWNVYSESYAESSALNMKVHSTSLAGIDENYSTILNDQYKKYDKQQRSELGKNELNVQVQKIGNEKLFSYNCMHVKISYTLKALGQTENMEDDEWYSAGVPGSQFLSPIIFENHSPDVVKKIIDAGCSGVLVKSITKSSGSSEVIQLSRITQKNMPDSTFNLPPNYQEDKNTALYDIQ